MHTYFISYIFDPETGPNSVVHANIEYESRTLLDSFEKVRDVERLIKRKFTDTTAPIITILNFILLNSSKDETKRAAPTSSLFTK